MLAKLQLQSTDLKSNISAVEMHAEMLDWNVHASVPLSGDMFTG